MRQNIAAAVRRIIDEKLAKSERVSKWFVIEQLKNRVSCILLFTRICNDPSRATNDGVKNVHRGAMKAVADTLRHAKAYRIEDDWIYRADEVSA